MAKKTKKRKVFVGNLDGDELNSDWLGSMRLMKKAEKGDVEARKELARREKSKMTYTLTEEQKAEIDRRLGIL